MDDETGKINRATWTKNLAFNIYGNTRHVNVHMQIFPTLDF